MFKFLVEGMGTFILVFTIGLTTEPLAAGLMFLILLFMGFSVLDEAHFNPALSLSVWAVGKNTTLELLFRFAGQFTGAIAAAFLVSTVSEITYIPKPGAATGVIEFILFEIFFSAVLVFLFLILIYPAAERNRYLLGFIGGAGFSGCLMVVEPVIGLGLHPAFNAAFSVIDYFQGGNSYFQLPIYFFGPFVGAFLASELYKRLIQIKS